MKHEIASERLLELVYGELSAREAREVEAHVEGCASCGEELARMRQTRALLSALPTEPPPEAGLGIVMAAAREVAEARRPRPLLPRWLWAGTAGAMAAAVVAVVSWQLVKHPGAGSSAERGSELLGWAPPPAPAPASAPAAAAPEAPLAPAQKPSAPAAGAEAKRVAKGEARPDAAAAPGWRPAEGAPSGGWSAPVVPAPARAKKAEADEAARPEGEERAHLGALGSGTGRGAGGAIGDARENGQVVRSERAMAVAPAAPPPPAPAAPAPAKASPPRAPSMAEPMAAAEAAPKAKDAAPSRKTADRADALALAKARAAERSAAATAARARRPLGAPGEVEVRTFAGCAGEQRRVIEYAFDGTVLRYVREGSRRTVEQVYEPSGQLVAAFATEAGSRVPLPLDAPGLVRSSDDVAIDGPPRCALP